MFTDSLFTQKKIIISKETKIYRKSNKQTDEVVLSVGKPVSVQQPIQLLYDYVDHLEVQERLPD